MSLKYCQCVVANLSHVLTRIVYVPVFATIHIRNRSNEGAWGAASSSRLVKLVRGDVYLADDMAMVCMVQCYHVLVACGTTDVFSFLNSFLSIPVCW